jgi:hypothetical protein
MLRTLVGLRGVIVLACAAAIGAWGNASYPVPLDHPLVAMIELREPGIHAVLMYGYKAFWFSTPLLMLLLMASLLTILAYRHVPAIRFRPLPPYPSPESRAGPSLVIGETHFLTQRGRAPAPKWLTIPCRGLYTGVLVLGASGRGKTTTCMYPFAEQLLRWRAGDPARKIGGLVMEVKGDFCHAVRDILTRAARETDYVEIGLKGNALYNPLHSDVDPYALAFGIGSLINNLYGKSKEPFWQQAYVDLLKNVILLRRITDGYTTFAEVYRYVVDDTLIDKDLRRLRSLIAQPPEVLAVSASDYHLHCVKSPWTLWYREDETTFAHAYDAELEAHLEARGLSYDVRRARGGAYADRLHQLDAIDRWYHQAWMRLDGRLRSSIIEGIVVVLGLFDSDPAVYRAFCPPRAAYANEPKSGEPRPLPPLMELVEAGQIVALNLPAAFNPALARLIGIGLKLNFHSGVLQRIALMASQPDRIWRDLLFLVDEYQMFASVGSTDPTGDERTLALSRAAKLISIVATQSLSSLRSAVPNEESFMTLIQCFGSIISMATADNWTAQALADRCGRRDRLKPKYTLSEAGQGAHISLLTGRATAARHTLVASKSYSLESDYIFPPRAFTELKNGEAIVLPYDGHGPLPPQYCYLKPSYRNVNTSYFDQEVA